MPEHEAMVASFQASGERYFRRPGAGFGVVDLGPSGGRMGMAICNDRRMETAKKIWGWGYTGVRAWE